MPTQGSQTVLTGPVTPVSTAATIALSRRRSNPALKQLTQLNTPHQPITPKHLQSTPPMFPTVPSHIAMTALNDTLRMPLPLSPNVGPQTVNMDKAARTSQPMDDSGYFGSSGQVAGRSGAGGLFELLPSGHVHLAEQLIDSFTEKGSTAVDRRRVVDLLANLFARSDQAYGLNGPLCPGERQFSFGLPAIPDNGEYQSMSSPIPASVIQTSVMKMSVPDIRVLALQRQDSVMSMHPHAAVMPTRTDRAEMSVEAFDGTFTLNQYVMLQSIGHGAQGEVFLSVDLDKNEMRAIKAIPRPGGGGKLASDARSPLELARANRAAQHEREIEVMKRCRHRNIVSLYEVIDDPSSDKLYLVMQYIEHGSLVTLLPDGTVSQVVKPELLAQYTRQLCAGLQYLHSHGVVHRDIKPDNILLGAGDTVYLSDFGVADVFDAHTHSSPIKGTRGTSAFLAPELVAAASAFDDPVVDGRAVDIWALGVTLYVMLFGRLPWDRTAKAVEFWRLVTEAEIHYPTIDPQNTVADDAWKALLRAMLQKKPQKRCTAEKARRLAKAVLQAYHDGGELVATDTLLPLVWESGKGPRPSVSDGSSDCMAFSGRTEEVSTTTNAASMRTDASS